jgi:hypothetical protein
MKIPQADLENWIVNEEDDSYQAIMATKNIVNRRYQECQQIPNWVDRNNFTRLIVFLPFHSYKNP